MAATLGAWAMPAKTSFLVKKRFLLTLYFILSICSTLFAQDLDTVAREKEFLIEAEFRPRAEYRNGYRQLKPDTSNSAFFIDQRSRLYLTYKAKRFIFHTSFQDVRVWGGQDPSTLQGTVQIFETYVEPSLSEKISVRIGRQKIMYDNQRLFAENNWRQTGRSHEAVRFMYRSKNLEADLIGAFNQEERAFERFFETDYSPFFLNYKYLFANFIKWQPTKKYTLTVINATDGFQDDSLTREDHFRFTSGGRIEFEQEKVYATVAAYYQYGNTRAGKNLRAFYVQPEIKLEVSKPLKVRVGAELMSGNDGTKDQSVSRSFDPLYGVNHRFMGSMDYFVRFPLDLNNAGLLNPYLFVFYDVGKKISLRADGHLFYSQNDFVKEGTVILRYLGFENDLLLTYTPNKFTELQLGYSYMLPTQSMQDIKRIGNYRNWQDWAFLMVTFTPELFRWQSIEKL